MPGTYSLPRVSKRYASLESLESRLLFTGTAIQIVEQTGTLGVPALFIQGTADADIVTIQQTNLGLQVFNGDLDAGTFPTDTIEYIEIHAGQGPDRISVDDSVTLPSLIYGGKGRDTLLGGSGNDTILAGLGADVVNGRYGTDSLFGAAGSDEIIGIAGTADTMMGGPGTDSFWANGNGDEFTDIDATETADLALHTVAQFMSYNYVDGNSDLQVETPPFDMNGENLPDPAADTPDATVAAVDNVFGLPLFGPSGPIGSDVSQKAVGDCYFLSTLSAIAATDPMRIRQSIAELGDGTYVVQLFDGTNTPFYARVDGDVPVDAQNHTIYADLGADGQSVWVCMIEKAFAEFRPSPNIVAAYSNVEGGNLSEPLQELHGDNRQFYTPGSFASDPSGATLAGFISDQLQLGQVVTYATDKTSSGVPLVGLHAYAVVGVFADANNRPYVELRNPWGHDLGIGVSLDGVDDGYVTVYASDLQFCMGQMGVAKM